MRRETSIPNVRLRGRPLLAAAVALAALPLPAQEQRVSGHVLEPLGDPAALVAVEVHDRFGRVVERTTTDAEGMFVTAFDPGAGHTLRAIRPGVRISPRIVPADDGVPVELRLHDCGRLHGRVVDRNGAPVADAHVTAALEVSPISALSVDAVTDDAGDFAVDAPLGWLKLRAHAPELGMAESTVWLRDAARVELRFPPKPGYRLDLAIDGLADGREVEVGLESRGALGLTHGPLSFALPLPLRIARTAQGRWQVEGVPANAVLRLWTLPYGPYTATARPDADGVLRFRFTAPDPPLRTFSASLRSRTGVPLPGRRLVLERWPDDPHAVPAVTGDDGTVSVPVRLPGGDCGVRLDDPDWKLLGDQRAGEVRSPWTGGRGRATLVAERGATLRGTVLDRDRPGAGRVVYLEVSKPDGAPFDGLSTAFHPGWEAVARTVADRKGEFEFRGIVAGNRLRVFVEPNVFVPVRGDAESGLETVRVTLPALATVEGVIRDPDGVPMQGAVVAFGQRVTVTDRAGRYRVRGLAPGTQSFGVTLYGDAWQPSGTFEAAGGVVTRRDYDVVR